MHATPATTGPRPAPAVYPASSTVLEGHDKRLHELADTMHRLLVEGGECTRGLLLSEGFSNHELDRMGTAARQLANRRFVRQDDAGEPKPPTDDELLDEAYIAVVGLIDIGLVTSTLRGKLLWTHDRIARIWPRLMPRLASTIAKTPIPRAQ